MADLGTLGLASTPTPALVLTNHTPTLYGINYGPLLLYSGPTSSDKYITGYGIVGTSTCPPIPGPPAWGQLVPDTFWP